MTMDRFMKLQMRWNHANRTGRPGDRENSYWEHEPVVHSCKWMNLARILNRSSDDATLGWSRLTLAVEPPSRSIPFVLDRPTKIVFRSSWVLTSHSSVAAPSATQLSSSSDNSSPLSDALSATSSRLRFSTAPSGSAGSGTPRAADAISISWTPSWPH